MFNPFFQDYKSFCSTVLPTCSVPVAMSHSSLYQSVDTSVPYVSPVRTPTVFFPFHISNTYSISNLMQSVFSELKTSSTRKSSLSSYQVNVSPKTFRTPITPYQENLISFPLLSPFTYQVKTMLALALLKSFLVHQCKICVSSSFHFTFQY